MQINVNCTANKPSSRLTSGTRQRTTVGACTSTTRVTPVYNAETKRACPQRSGSRALPLALNEFPACCGEEARQRQVGCLVLPSSFLAQGGQFCSIVGNGAAVCCRLPKGGRTLPCLARPEGLVGGWGRADGTATMFARGGTRTLTHRKVKNDGILPRYAAASIVTVRNPDNRNRNHGEHQLRRSAVCGRQYAAVSAPDPPIGRAGIGRRSLG